MKKLFIGIAFLGALIFAAPSTANAESDCDTMVLKCPNGTQHTAIVCDFAQYQEWCDILCGASCMD